MKTREEIEILKAGIVEQSNSNPPVALIALIEGVRETLNWVLEHKDFKQVEYFKVAMELGKEVISLENEKQ